MTPDPLWQLGAALEAATGRAVRRRQTRLQTVRGAAVAVLLAVPFVLASAPGQLSDAAGPLPDVPRIVDTALLPPTIAFMVRHIPDEKAESKVTLPCLDGRDCRVPERPSLQPAPPGKV